MATAALYPNLPHLPHDIIYSGILTRLPVKSLFRFRCVCKLWNATIGDPDFIKSHSVCAQQNSSSTILGLYRVQTKDSTHCSYIFSTTDVPQLFRFDIEKSIEFIGHCNGLFCFRSELNFAVCNPCTREFLCHPLPPPPPPDHPISYGFGFDPLANQYKLVQIVHANRSFYRCMVYTLGSENNSWREIVTAVNLSHHFTWRWRLREQEHYDIGGTVNSGRALYKNGTLIWFFRRPHLFMTFDLQYEKFEFSEGPIPKYVYLHFSEKPDCHCFLIELQGFVCLAFQNYDGNIVHLYNYTESSPSGWYFEQIDLQFKSILRVGALSAESLLYSFTQKDLTVYSLENHNGRLHPLVGSASKFPLPVGVDHSLVNECQFTYHLENLISLKTLVRSSPTEVKYIKKRRRRSNPTEVKYMKKRRRKSVQVNSNTSL